MCCTQPTRIDHMCKKEWIGGRRGAFRALVQERRATVGCSLALAHNLTNCRLFPAASSLLQFIYLYFCYYKEVWGWAWHFGRMDVQHSKFFNLEIVFN
jgi:hypothetical protein